MESPADARPKARPTRQSSLQQKCCPVSSHIDQSDKLGQAHYLLSKREGVVGLNRHSQHILVAVDHRVWDGGQSGVVQSQTGSRNTLDSKLYS